MYIGLFQADLKLNLANSLKEKRRVLNSIKMKFQNKFQVSIRESAFQEQWQSSRLVMVKLIDHEAELNKMENFLFDLSESESSFSIVKTKLDWLHLDELAGY